MSATVVGTAPTSGARYTTSTDMTARPGMLACELYGIYAYQCQLASLLPLDRLGNVGHSIGHSTSYDEGYIDPWNQTPMWGAWAIEPHTGNYIQAIKVEDVVWLGPEGCIVIR